MRLRRTSFVLLAAGACALADHRGLSLADERPAASAARAGTAGAKSLLVRVRGKWLLESRTILGVPQQVEKGVFLLVTNEGQMEDHVPNGRFEEAGTTIVGRVDYRINPTSDPAQIDATGMANWTAIRRGMLKLEGETLTLCWSKVGEARPTRFETGEEPGDGRVLLTYRKAK